MESIGTPFLWLVFAGVVVAALLVDLVLMRHGGPHKVTFQEATWWSLGWVALALAFNAWLWWHAGNQFGEEAGNRIGMEFLTGYLVKKSLAVDNIFVFLMIFGYFAVPEVQRQRVLIIGILGAIALRAILDLRRRAAARPLPLDPLPVRRVPAVHRHQDGAGCGQEPDLDANPALRWMRGHLRLTGDYHGNAFRIVRDGARWFTPLFVVVILVAVTDVIFAVDSIPAIFAITDDPFIVLTSNVFAVLGLRAMFFLLQGMADRFHLLPYGLAMVLVFIGAKMLLVDVYKIPVLAALAVVALIIGATVVLSLLRPPANPPPAP